MPRSYLSRAFVVGATIDTPKCTGTRLWELIIEENIIRSKDQSQSGVYLEEQIKHHVTNQGERKDSEENEFNWPRYRNQLTKMM